MFFYFFMIQTLSYFYINGIFYFKRKILVIFLIITDNVLAKKNKLE